MPHFTHPGQIRMVDMFTHDVTVVQADAVPERQRFVFYKNDLETQDAATATRAVPIVEARLFALDANGTLVPKAQAVRIRILEIGPEGQTLRSTTMVSNTKR